MPGLSVANTDSASQFIQDMFFDEAVNALYYNDFFGLQRNGNSIFPKVLWGGGSSVKWAVRRGANTTTEVFTEGQALQEGSYQKYSEAAVSWTYARATIQLTGHALDAMQSTSVPIDAINSEVVGASEDISDLLTTSFLGSTYGLELSVDSTSTYAGIARGAATWWESAETAVGGALKMSDLIDLHEGCVDNSRGANPSAGLWVVPWNQVTNIFNLAGVPGMKTFDPSDPAASWGNSSIAGGPVIGVGDLTDTVILHLDVSPGKFAIPVIRPFRVEFQQRAGDSTIYQCSTGAAFVNKNPVKDGKLTGVTA